MTDKDHSELDRLRGANEQREEELHERGACTDRILPQLRAEAFIDVVVEALGVGVQLDLAVERRREDAYVDINRSLDNQEAEQRQASLLGRPFPVRGGDGQ